MTVGVVKSVAFAEGSAVVGSVTAPLVNPMSTTGDLIYSSDNSGTAARLAAGNTGKRLISAGTGVAPAWGFGTTITKSADYTILDTDGYDTFLVSASTGTVTITLPLAANNMGRIITIKKADAATGKVTVSRGGSNTIEGYTSTNLGDGTLNVYSSLTFATDGTGNWYVIACGGDVMLQSRVRSASQALTSPNASNVTASPLTLPPGDWELSGAVTFESGSGASVGSGTVKWSVSQTTAAISGSDTSAVPTAGEVLYHYSAAIAASLQHTGVVPPHRVSITSSTAFYLVAIATFSGGTLSVYGHIKARRIR